MAVGGEVSFLLVQAELASLHQSHGRKSLPLLWLHYTSRLNSGDMPFPARNYSLLMPLLRGRSHFCKHALRQAAIPLPSVSDDDKRVHAVIKASFAQAMEFIDARLIEITPKQVGLRKKQTTDVDRQRAGAAARG